MSLPHLKKLENCQNKLASLRDSFDREVRELETLIERHYFNRENGFLDEQQKNLREVVGIQSRVDAVSAQIAEKSAELKKLMIDVQKSIHGGGAPTEEAASPVEEPPAKEEPKPAQEGESFLAVSKKKKTTAGLDDRSVFVSSELVNRSGDGLLDKQTMGGEISIRLMVDSLKLREPANRDILFALNNSLKEMLYQRKLIGYSATALVFGKNTTLESILDDLLQVFTSDALKNILIGNKLVATDEIEGIKLACNSSYELIYRVD